MKLKYYGTAAAEGVPAIYCGCDTCKKSKELSGKNIRTRSQALVNDRLLIDMPPDSLYHYQFLGLALDEIEHLLITHKHPDHLHPPTLNFRSERYVTHKLAPLNIYGSMPTIDLIFDELRKGGVLDRGRWNLFELAPYEKKTIDGFEVVAYRANHDFATYPYIYEICDKEKRMLYAHDSGYFLDEVWEHLERNKPYFNLVSLDCTMGISPSIKHAHMNIDDCVCTREKMLRLGCADEKSIFVLNHFSHNGRVTYDELVPMAAECGFLVSYDGMEIEF